MSTRRGSPSAQLRACQPIQARAIKAAPSYWDTKTPLRSGLGPIARKNRTRGKDERETEENVDERLEHEQILHHRETLTGGRRGGRNGASFRVASRLHVV